MWVLKDFANRDLRYDAAYGWAQQGRQWTHVREVPQQRLTQPGDAPGAASLPLLPNRRIARAMLEVGA
eukprot:7422257-Alexandrium_andersonii.AAC.1